MADDPKRLQLHTKLVELLGTSNVYFQPPDGRMLKYPCIVYNRRSADTSHAEDMPYIYTQSYDVTYISKSPSDGMVRKIATSLRGARFDRHFVADGLNHDNFFVPSY